MTYQVVTGSSAARQVQAGIGGPSLECR